MFLRVTAQGELSVVLIDTETGCHKWPACDVCFFCLFVYQFVVIYIDLFI